MTPDRWRQIEELYHSARERGVGVLVDTDPELRREVERLLAQDSDGKILATSDGPDGNVGFEKTQWEKMLRATAAKLREKEIKTLLEKVKE